MRFAELPIGIVENKNYIGLLKKKYFLVYSGLHDFWQLYSARRAEINPLQVGTMRLMLCPGNCFLKPDTQYRVITEQYKKDFTILHYARAALSIIH